MSWIHLQGWLIFNNNLRNFYNNKKQLQFPLISGELSKSLNHLIVDAKLAQP